MKLDLHCDLNSILFCSILSFCRRPRDARYWSAAAVPKKSSIPDKILFYPQHFLMTFFSHRKLQQNKYIEKIASAARRQIIGGGAPINKSRRRRRQQITLIQTIQRRLPEVPLESKDRTHS